MQWEEGRRASLHTAILDDTVRDFFYVGLRLDGAATGSGTQAAVAVAVAAWQATLAAPKSRSVGTRTQ